MPESLADIETLALRCRSEQSKEYVMEAILCYRSGAYRSAIVSVWIAIVFDLIDKIKELALSGESSAKELEYQFNNYVSQIEAGNSQGFKSALEFERNILSTCRDRLQFFDSQQFTDLSRLREDRHRCAHPSFQQAGIPYHPSAEQARLHIRNAVVYVLSQPPVQGKAALAELKALVGSEYFPNEVKKAQIQLKNSGLEKPSDALIKGFVDQLIFGFFEDGNSLFRNKNVVSAINAVFEMYPSLVEDRLKTQLNKAIRNAPDDQMWSGAYLAAHISSSWRLLEEASKNKLAAFVEKGPTTEVLGGLDVLSKFDELKPVVIGRVNKLEESELINVVNNHGLKALAKDRALNILSEAGSWNYVNRLFNELIFPLFDNLDKNDVERIIKMPSETGADLLGASGYYLFVERIRRSKLLPTHDLNELLKENGAGYLVLQVEEAEA